MFHVGDLWKPTATIVDPETDLLVDPTTVVVTVTAPSKSVSMPTVEHLETGVYRVKVSLTEVGSWLAVTTTTGTYQASRPLSIRVLPNE